MLSVVATAVEPAVPARSSYTMANCILPVQLLSALAIVYFAVHLEGSLFVICNFASRTLHTFVEPSVNSKLKELLIKVPRIKPK